MPQLRGPYRGRPLSSRFARESRGVSKRLGNVASLCTAYETHEFSFPRRNRAKVSRETALRDPSRLTQDLVDTLYLAIEGIPFGVAMTDWLPGCRLRWEGAQN